MRHENLVEQEAQSPSTTQAADYLAKLQQLGALEGKCGDREVSQEIAPVLEALHHVLAGGKVELKVSSPGNEKVVGELNRLFGTTVKVLNAAERAAGMLAIPLGF
jgi:hypothetical protein